jgi:DNA-binding CsgD family transcriptional regulator
MSASAGWRSADLEPLLHSGLLEVDGRHRVRFASESARDLVLAAAPLPVVQAAHRRAADACRELHLPLLDRLDHLVSSTVVADDSVASELEELALEAEAAAESRLASEAWRAAARLSITASDRAARAVRCLRLVIVAGLDYVDTDDLLDLLAGEQLSSESACWVEWLRSLRLSEASPDAAVTAQWSSIQRARDAAPGTLRALLWDAAMNAWTLGDAPGGLRAAREYVALEAAMDGDDAGIEAPWTGTALLAAALYENGDVGQASTLRDEAIAAAADVDPVAIALDRLVSIVFLDDLLLDMGPQASRRLVVCEERAAQEPATLACLLGIEAWRARSRGQWDVADGLLARGRPLAAEVGATGAQAGMAALAIEMAAIRGDDAALDREVPALRVRARGVGDLRRLATVDRALGLRALSEGRLDEAVVRLAAAADCAFLGRRLRDGVLPARVDLVEALVRQGDLDAARMRAASVRPLLAAMRDPLASALERRVAGLVADDGLGLADLEEALVHHACLPEVFERARTLVLLAELERRSRQSASARRHLIEAIDAFDGLGAGPWADRARRELRALGGRVELDASGEHLTAQEQAVARCVAQGRSTREVAEMLFLSPRTVEYHLGNVYRKLGVHGRAALAARLGNQGD